MKLESHDVEIVAPREQLNLFGYDSYFNFFIKLFEKGMAPKSLLLSGPRGLGKSTFTYHFINYLLSKLMQLIVIQKHSLKWRRHFFWNFMVLKAMRKSRQRWSRNLRTTTVAAIFSGPQI